MKKIKIISLIFLLLFSFSCKKFLDVNHDPNNPEESTVELVFPAGVESTSGVFGGSWLILGEIWSQHWTSQPNAPSYQGEDKYEIQAGDYNYDLRGWESLYTAALMDYEWVKIEAEKEENWTFYLMATVMQCYTYQVLVDFFDEIPMSDALQKLPAKFDDGQDVYDSLIVRIDYALSKDLEAETCQKPGQSDVVFGGSMENWIAFANTLKLKIYLRQRYVRPAVAEAGINQLYNDGVSFLTTDASFDNFADESGRDNYCYARGFRGRVDVCPSKTILDYLDDEKDKRLNFIFTSPDEPEEGPNTEPVNHYGIYQGDLKNVYSHLYEPATYSEPYVYALQPVYFISEVESLLLQAEACLVYGKGDAEALYQSAKDADFTRKNVVDKDGISVEATYTAFTTDEEENLETIMVEKWIALTNTQGMETFFEHNRTGYPRESAYDPSMEDFTDEYVKGEFTKSITGVLSPPVLFPKRLLLPASEESKNPHFPSRKPLNVKVWWDVKVYPYL